jgi:cell division protein FtsI (penicillin-binding protein 3)
LRKNRDKKTAKQARDWFKFRVVSLLVFLLVWMSGLCVRLAELTLFSDSRVESYSARQAKGKVKIDLPRGVIYDRNYNELAVSVMRHSVYVNPRKVKNVDLMADRLSAILEKDKKTNRKKLRRRLYKMIKRKANKRFVWVKRKVSPAVYARLKAEKLIGVGFVKEAKRYYPKRDIAARIIGYSGMDDQGLYGLEIKYDDLIKPASSRFTVLKDALGRPVSMPSAVSIAEKALPHDLVLTIDERIEYVVESALERKVLQSGAKGGVAIVIDPTSGEILAMAEQPRYNPNSIRRYRHRSKVSRSVSTPVEPGSTFKLFVVAGALEENLLTPLSKIDCENGKYRIADHVFKEANRGHYKLLTASEVIEKSSNIGAIKMAQALGPDLYSSYLKKFGFGRKTGIDLPGESSGLLLDVKDWSKTSLPSISFGQGIGVTPIQLVQGLSVFADNGIMHRPHLVRGIARGDKFEKISGGGEGVRIISAETAKMVTRMMVDVVEKGTGKAARIDGFVVAGKSGTAQKIDPATRRYSPDKFLSSFAGFFPAYNPRLAILVMIDEPKGVAWGGAVAGPVFADIGKRVARILRIPSTNTPVYQIAWNRVINADGKKTTSKHE